MLLLCLGAGLVEPVHAAELRGEVTLTGRDGSAAPRGSRADFAVVYFRPAQDTAAQSANKPKPAATFEMRTTKKQFEPRVLTIPVGSVVTFPNFDPILHNVFSVSGRNRFDLGLYRKGPGKTHRFTQPGVIRVFCNVHRDMAAYILVLDTPHSKKVAADGTFRLSGLPARGGTLTVWHPQTAPFVKKISAGHRGSIQVPLKVIRKMVPDHSNKTGKRYTRRKRDRYD